MVLISYLWSTWTMSPTRMSLHSNVHPTHPSSTSAPSRCATPNTWTNSPTRSARLIHRAIQPSRNLLHIAPPPKPLAKFSTGDRSAASGQVLDCHVERSEISLLEPLYPYIENQRHAQ